MSTMPSGTPMADPKEEYKMVLLTLALPTRRPYTRL